MNDTVRGQRALAIFDAVADLDGEARERRLAERCEGDAALLAQVRALLAADAEATDPFGNAPRWSEAMATDATEGDRQIGRSIGAWKIVSVIGHGGMGAVYAVERGDGAYAQRAALKLIRASADSPAAHERFLRERQILAGLQHANIATLLDGGFSTGGEPYFVMERIEGEPIDRWCDARRLGLRERIVLFLQVLEAVRYAHRNLVVHRDLKPSNLLVDADGRVKLLDFGIAKQLQDSGATATLDRALTFEYASPEQLHDAPITTATDLWQLGVILHRLLSGAHPFGLTRDTPLASQLQQLEREPEPLTRAAAQASAEQAARRGGMSPASLSRALRGSLADIVQACLRRDPEQRYASADALASDLRAWLDNRPIAAVPLSRMQRTRLWLRRNRVLAAATAAVVVALLAGTGVALWQAGEARAQARMAEQRPGEAERQSANARAAMQFLTDTLNAAAPENALSTEVSVRQLLDTARAKLDENTQVDARVKQPVQRMLGQLYYSLGEPRIAAKLFEQGISNVEPVERGEALAFAVDLDYYSGALGSLDLYAQSMATEQRAADLRQRFAPDDTGLRVLSLDALGYAQYKLGDYAKAAQTYREGLALAGTMRQPPVDVVINSSQMLAYVLLDSGQPGQARQVAEDGLRFAATHAVPRHSPLWVNLFRAQGDAYFEGGDAQKAERPIRDAIAVQEASISKGYRLGTLYNSLARVLEKLGRHDEAIAAWQHAISLLADAGAGNIDLARNWGSVAIAHAKAGNLDQASAAYQRAVNLLDAADDAGARAERKRIEQKLDALAQRPARKPSPPANR
jgi:serine/threonine-protein kinase